MRKRDGDNLIMWLLLAGAGYWLYSSGWLAQFSHLTLTPGLAQANGQPPEETPATGLPAGTVAVDRPRRGILIAGGGWGYDPGIFWHTWGGPLEPQLPDLPVGWSEHGPHMIN